GKDNIDYFGAVALQANATLLHYWGKSLSLCLFFVRGMERVKRHKVWAVWLLLAVFALPFAVKAVHIRHTSGHSGHSCHDESHERHDCHDCPVCQFTLSSFTEATAVDYDFKVVSYHVKPVISFRKKPYQKVLISYGLRAPPLV
ncbi:MAG: hypothetical protein LBU37_16015, partial [Tannerellaceae bacterium]|nr:hypothetical protein [Tannerellaceae bacterium]